MAEDKPDLDPLKENVQTPIDPNEAAAAVKELDDAMAILPRKRFGCLARLAKYGAVLLVLLAVFVYWNFLRTPRLKISKETTYISEPLTSDGTRVDYFAAFEREFFRPDMNTEDNGYRLIVRALGDVADDEQNEAHSAQIYKKLGLDPEIEPTMNYIETLEFLQKYCVAEGLDEKQAEKLDAKVYEPWTLDDLPMMEPWLEENGPVLDLVGEAVRRPAFCFPQVRPSEDATLVEAIVFGELHRTRSFARMLQTRAHYRIGIGDIDGAIDDVITCERLGRHVECQGTVVARLVGIAVEGIAGSLGVAAIRESQPTEEQLRRFVDELNELPPRPDMDRTRLAARYYTLDSLQTLAIGGESLAAMFSSWEHIEEYKPRFAAYISVDWNIVMRRVNAQYDDLDKAYILRPPMLSLGNLFIGARSRRVADVWAGLSMPSFQATREASRRTNCVRNLRRIMLAMLIYQHEHGTLPPAYTVDAAGNPLHSWRVLLLPYLGEEELYGKLRLDEPWGSEHNRQFHGAAIAIYQCPSAELKPGQTTYSVVVGENTAFQAGEGKSLDDLGMNLILVVEREPSSGRDGERQSVCWMDPTSELAESIAFEGINRREEDVYGIGSHHPGGVQVGSRNGSVLFIPATIGLPSLRSLLDGTAEKYPY